MDITMDMAWTLQPGVRVHPKSNEPLFFPGASVHSDAVQRLKKAVRGLSFETHPVVSRI